MESVVNDEKLLVCVFDEVGKFKQMREVCGIRIRMNVLKKAESDVGGSLNDGLNDLSDVFILNGAQMIAPNGLLEFVK